jgi:hypothetical protein
MPSRRAPPRNRIACGTIDTLFGFIPHGRAVRQDNAGRLRSAALIYIRAPDGRVLRGKWVPSASDRMKKTPKTKGSADGQRTGKAVGDALREAYDEAIGEAIPDEMLDLLKKLD